MKNTKTTIRELSARYRDILKKCFFLNAVALGLFAATSASASVGVESGSDYTVYTTGEVDTLLGAKANAADVYTKTESETAAKTAVLGELNTTTSDIYAASGNAAVAAVKASINETYKPNPVITTYTFDKYGDGSEMVSIDSANLTGALGEKVGTVDSSWYSFDYQGGTTTLAATTSVNADDAVYQFTGHDDATTTYNAGSTISAGNYSYTKTAADGTTSTVALTAGDISDTPTLATTGYDFAVTTAQRADAATSVSIDNGTPVYGDYQFTYDAVTYNLADYITTNGDLALSKELGETGHKLSEVPEAVVEASKALNAHGSDTIAYNTVQGRYDTSNTAYGTAVGNVNTDTAELASQLAEFTADSTAFDAALGKKNAAQTSLNTSVGSYNTAYNGYKTYSESLAVDVDNRADAAIVRGLAEGGAIRTAVTAGITDLITTKEGLLSQDIGYNLADPDNETTGLVARLDALTDESTDKTLVGAINANTGAIATLDSTKVNNADNFTADTDSALIKGKTVVAAIQDTAAQVDTNTTAIGTLASLTTDEKSNLVGAVNELNSTKVNNAGNFTADTDSALIKDKTVVAAIQSTAAQVDTNTADIGTINTTIGDISQLNTTRNITTAEVVTALNDLDTAIYTKVGDGAVTASSYTATAASGAPAPTLTQHVTAIGSALDASVGTRTEIANIHGSYLAQKTAPSAGAGSEATAPTLAAQVQALNTNLEATLGTADELQALFAGAGESAPTNLAGYLNQQATNAAATQAGNEAAFAQLDSKLQKLETKMEKGLAANNALAGLVPLDHVHKTQLSAALGGYKDNQALAVGAFHYLNDRTLLNAGAAYGGNSSVSYKVGVTFGF